MFPNEIFKLIVDELAYSRMGPWRTSTKALRSCCLAARLFVPLCQEHIFRDVILDRLRHRRRLSQVSRTKRLANLLLDQRHLGLYVHTLTYTMDFPNDLWDVKIAQDLWDCIPNLVELTLHVSFKRTYATGVVGLPYHLGWYRHLWEQYLRDRIFKKQKLKKLALSHLCLPADAFAHLAGLETLILSQCYFEPMEDEEEAFCCTETTALMYSKRLDTNPVYIKRLMSDDTSLMESRIVPHDDYRPRKRTYISLEKLECLCLNLIEIVHAEPIFKTLKSIQDLTINVESYVEYQDNDEVVLPFSALPFSAFSTLTRLSLYGGYDFNSLDERTGLTENPYFGLCAADALPNLLALEYLSLNIQIRGYIPRDPERALRPRLWGELDAVVAPRSPITLKAEPFNSVLKEVSVLVYIKSSLRHELCDDEYPDWEECAEAIESGIYLWIYPAQFPAMVRLSREGRMRFRFGTKVLHGDGPDTLGILDMPPLSTW